jgi:putative Holliday junction resolvase
MISRVVGLDLGSRRIGVAVSDGLGLTAQPHSTIQRHGGLRDLEEVAGIVRAVGATRVVVGLPLNHEGDDATAGDPPRRARAFAARLAAHLKLPVDLIDESFSTVEAEEVLLEADLSRSRRKEVIDKMAAAVILQRWLDAQRAAGVQP